MRRLAIVASMLITFAGSAQKVTGSFVAGSAADETAIRAIVANDSADITDVHEAADLDWENAFGIRFYDLKKRNDWYNKGVKPQFKDATVSSLEVNVRFLEPTVAVADEYWHVVGQVYAGQAKPGADRWGRTTYIFKKEHGIWVEVMQRVADLRSPYFKHYSELPKSVAVPAKTLASYTGSYVGPTGKAVGVITLDGDRLKTKYANDEMTYVLVAVSATDFLEFNPDMVATYQKLTFSTSADGTVSVNFARADGKSLGSAAKAVSVLKP